MLAAAFSVVLLSHANRLADWEVPFEHWGGHFLVAEAGGMLLSASCSHQLLHAKSQGADQIVEGIRMQPPPLADSSLVVSCAPSCSLSKTHNMHACSGFLSLLSHAAGRLGGVPSSIGVAIFRLLKRVVCFLSASTFCISFQCIICGGLYLWFRALIRYLKAFACNLPPWRFQPGRLQKTRCAPSRRLF